MTEFSIEDIAHSLQTLNNTLSLEQYQQAAMAYELVIGSIADQPTGVIQDPAGSAIGTGFSPMGGGLSGAIYRMYQLDPIPHIEPGCAIMNSTTGDGKRILHTHSYQLHNATDIWEATRKIADSYLQAIQVFIANVHVHGQNTLHFSAVSAAIFAGQYRNPLYNHLDPSVTQMALVHALATYESAYPAVLSEYTFNLFYFGDPIHPTPLYLKAQQVQQALRQCAISTGL